MRAYVIADDFGLNNLKIVERPTPEPRPHEVRVQVRAVSLNYRDLMMVRGHYNPRQPLPLVPCSDGAGAVSAVGSAVTRFKVGDRVAGCFFQDWASRPVPRTKAAIRSSLGGPIDGMLAEEVCLSEDGVVHIPSALSDLEASTLPCAALTAWSALIAQGGLKAGDSLLIQGTGGVALFALAFAKMVGARVLITSSSDDKLARARTLGADETINYLDNPKWGKTASALTEGIGVDHVLELGGAGTLAQSLAAVRSGGQISMIGVLAGGAGEINLTPILMRNIRVQGVLVGPRADFEAMNRAIEHNGLTPNIDRAFGFEESQAAFEYLASAQHFGKICISMDA